MVKKIGKRDIMLRVCSLLASIALWFYVAYVENPDIELWFHGIGIVYVNDSLLADKNLVRLPDDTASLASVKISGSRKALLTMEASDISASVDVSDISTKGTYSLPITLRFPISGITITDKKPYNAVITIDELTTVTKSIELSVSGTPDKSCTITGHTTDISTVTLTGPKTVLASIDKCVAAIDVNGITTTKTAPAEIKLLLEDGSSYSSGAVTLSNTHVTATINVSLTKVVPTLANLVNVDALSVKEVKVTPAEIRLTGTPSALDTVSSLYTEPIVLTGAENGPFSAALSFPAGVASPDGISTVTVEIIYN